jgi:hypothetical protein
LAGGHWVWSAALRYLYLTLMLAVWLCLRHGPALLVAVLRLFARQLAFWLIAGGVGFGLFYTGICFAADHAPGWIIAATWQVTLLLTPLILLGFGVRVPLRGVAFSVVIVIGVLVVNIHRIAEGVPWVQVALGVLPVVVAAACYPFGNQLVNRARHAGGAAGVLLGADPAVAVLLLTLGAMPLFAALIVVIDPPPPSNGQLISTAAIAIVSGGLATSLFLHARNLSSDPIRIAAVDATQAGEVVFAMAAEIIFLGAAVPDFVTLGGLLVILAGLAGFVFGSRAVSMQS